jgi:hypothetical protein
MARRKAHCVWQGYKGYGCRAKDGELRKSKWCDRVRGKDLQFRSSLRETQIHQSTAESSPE